MSPRRQLVLSSNGDTFLKDQIMTSVDNRSVQTEIRDRIQSIAQQLTNRIASRLSENLRHVGSAYVKYDGIEEEHPSDHAMYTTGQKFVRAAGRRVKTFTNKRAFAIRISGRDRHAQGKYKQRSPS